MENDAGWNAPKIGLVASLALELLSKFGFGEAIGKAWHDAARNVDPTSGAESQCEVSGNGTQQGTEHIECGATDVATILERSPSDLRGISVGHGHTIDGRQRLIEVCKAGSRQDSLYRYMLKALAQLADDALLRLRGRR